MVRIKKHVKPVQPSSGTPSKAIERARPSKIDSGWDAPVAVKNQLEGLSAPLKASEAVGVVNGVFIDPALRALNLQPKKIEQAPVNDVLLAKDLRSKDALVDIEFGRLTREQFDGLRDFCAGVSRVPYESARTYRLTDFLSPQMQALRGLDFKAPTVEVPNIQGFMVGDAPSEKERIGSTAQCWGTAWNNIVSLQHPGGEPTPFEVGFIDPQDVLSSLLSDVHSEQPPAQADSKFGDLLAMYTQMPDGSRILAHFPIYIGFGLVFEKEDSSVGNPYRTLSFEDSKRGVESTVKSHQVHQKGKLVVERRRFLGTAKPPLPKMSRVVVPDQETFDYFGRKAARLAFYNEGTLGGAHHFSADLRTRVSFGIDETGKGFIWNRAAQPLFFPAYEGITQPGVSPEP